MARYIDIHVLQTLPPNNINRDDTGAPKSAIFGGVPRQRVSSQAWKRAMRKDFEQHVDVSILGVRTKRVVGKIVETAESIAHKRGETTEWDVDQKNSFAAQVEGLLSAGKIKTEKTKKSAKAKKEAEATGEETSLEFAETGYLLFLSNQQIHRIAETILDNPETKWTKRDAADLLDQEHSVDIAMFGRMVADESAYNVDAAVQVAHAIGVGASEPEFDYFTAVDDEVQRAEETGAGMIGTVQMTSSTLYRYATVNLDGLQNNLGDADVTKTAALAFVQSFLSAMPTGKQNTFANNTLPEAAVVILRDDRPVSLVNAFEEPVPAQVDGGRRREAARRLAEEVQSLNEMYDIAPLKSWVLSTSALADVLNGIGSRVNRTQLMAELDAELEPQS